MQAISDSTVTQPEKRLGDWSLQQSGVMFYPLDPRPNEILIEDIAHNLSRLNRYNGAISCEHYSVAEHSVRVSWICPPDLRLYGLLHDAAEAYLSDLTSPIKHYSRLGDEYTVVENNLAQAIFSKFGLKWTSPKPELVKRADKAMIWFESQKLMPAHSCWDAYKHYVRSSDKPLGSVTWNPNFARTMFLHTFFDLGGVVDDYATIYH